MYEAFIDLDELIVRCRDKLSRKFIQEAVSCYRAGAFRSCIVATWNAVVFDFLHKLRELELLGDLEASRLLEQFNNLRSSDRLNKFRELWQFESDIPQFALTRFELISNVEKSDIERLFEDRSRCAHPSMTSLEEPFEATAELARYHLRSAVSHLLQHPPVQGRAARERIFQDISSAYFPSETELAVTYFQNSPLARARFTLVKDVVIGLTKSLLIEERSEDERARQLSALNAVSSMYFQETREMLNSQLSEIILSRVSDENWDKVINYLGSVTAWEDLSEPCRLKAEAFIDRLDIFEKQQKYPRRLSQQAISILVKASRIDFLKQSITKKLQLSLKDLLLLKDSCGDDSFKEMIIIPILRELSPQANLDELISMRTEASLKSDGTIEANIREKIQSSSLWELTSTASKYQDEWLISLIELALEENMTSASLKNLLAAKARYKLINEQKDKILELFDISIEQQVKQEVGEISLEEVVAFITRYEEDDFFIALVEPELEKKISTVSLDRLLEAKSTYKFLATPENRILEIFDRFISQQVKSTRFNDLFEQRRHWDEIPNNLLEPILKNNVLEIIKRFEKSGSFDSAAINTRLIIKIAEYLSPVQWESILEAFFENSQLCGSYRCKEGFESLFKKSLELSQSVQPYWLNFREKLNRFNDSYSNSLKRLIDSNL
ncbi:MULTISPECIES: hypothetical protein [Leptolyngbya]|uniref:hypothetical protein n=1 Tax=Leptolyngbya TaxID=47251 RepID=UPI001689B089|nr:hypothetical protein [Leptolyngbya sp. FACHB-1624]MBD1855690.1 hypothetical protein [Leptolyngbya sp. FACHB-1624]